MHSVAMLKILRHGYEDIMKCGPIVRETSDDRKYTFLSLFRDLFRRLRLLINISRFTPQLFLGAFKIREPRLRTHGAKCEPNQSYHRF